MVAALAPRLVLLALLDVDCSITEAARRLGIPQPTASRWLAQLGAELGAAVTVKIGRRVRLTAAGEHLVRSAVSCVAALRDGCRQVAGERDPRRGRVSFAFLNTMGQRRVPELLRGFRLRHPDVRFVLSQGSGEEVLAQVESGECDLALMTRRPGCSQLEQVVLGEQRVVAAIPASHPLARRARIRIGELAGERFVGFKESFGFRKFTDDLCRAAGFTPRQAFAGEDVETVRRLVAVGLGVALLPADEQPVPDGATEIPLDPGVVREIALVWRAGGGDTPAVSAFRDHVLSAYGSGPS
ncbi:LysR substrate-binding domain-containing protein [Amycolatopsis sp. NPDC051903]|uniref:LysR family transcriptional regulator n=1 Tax=Amycolatopsis sp. NPDC051903 TaxID=3363936 RepID=UPI003799D280